ncbi:hypothetical protein [Yersinia enterocolitica]|uniref:hypothetical protein n=1 Tax=Yersinia enterocolitica TaxID=630 RepID=UPI001C60963D|nr:hypothetical protein [Yersinia enterocolitica]EKN4068024.1 hypothetical protein [Yersinia enterocolitica]EKN4177916.1 hypothetical protein [Yersinia enterocolitica]MBW5876432.1 hypothetical protein [Yersinia enterocolitica]MDN0099215.1 hypothetical protein [Yersinia enterocolitica]
MRKLIIFGNGLGMAIDPVHFSLTNALNSVWQDDLFLNDIQRRQISYCIPADEPRCPQSENELDRLHIVKTCCNILNNIEVGAEIHWLSNNGREFPELCQRFIYRVATKLHCYNGDLPRSFIDSLSIFVRRTRTHIATLNYDKVLYGSFIDNGILNGYSGTLVDGMLNSGFEASNLEREYQNDFGYYLHLHGSPLFIDDEDTCYKLQRHEIERNYNVSGKHIVLTHIKHKPAVISDSKVLRAYWQYLTFSLNEITEVIIFGYSGLDVHLNDKLRMYKDRVRFKVVEWDGAGSQEVREQFWNRLMGNAVELIRLPNITSFTEW